MKHKYPLLSLLLIALSLSGVATAQNDLDAADEAFRLGYYKTAVDHYRAAYRKSADPNIAYKIAESHRLSNDYAKAAHYYKIVEQSTAAALHPHTDYFLALMYRMSGHPDSAAFYYQRYLRTANNE